GDGGEMLLRELKNNSEWEYAPVAFVDDDRLKAGKVLYGLPVLNGNDDLEDLCRSRNVSEVVISTRYIAADRLKAIREACRRANVTLKRAELKIEPLDFG